MLATMSTPTTVFRRALLLSKRDKASVQFLSPDFAAVVQLAWWAAHHLPTIHALQKAHHRRECTEQHSLWVGVVAPQTTAP
mmetsp:Transcript_8768/g.20879  ORF Transcript_8768/g.20879 Transcript_8768/m.20879 type:complete len:81 (-) Transcript_8768:621-863(-)